MRLRRLPMIFMLKMLKRRDRTRLLRKANVSGGVLLVFLRFRTVRLLFLINLFHRWLSILTFIACFSVDYRDVHQFKDKEDSVVEKLIWLLVELGEFYDSLDFLFTACTILCTGVYMLLWYSYVAQIAGKENSEEVGRELGRHSPTFELSPAPRLLSYLARTIERNHCDPLTSNLGLPGPGLSPQEVQKSNPRPLLLLTMTLGLRGAPIKIKIRIKTACFGKIL
ncbi:hypothetical protein C8R41DRAFT_90407 [Lentinula lateritia]|uniref:Cytochrome P450 n=1 Tax=Lentinula lateritia TaxID=40482 RepID=A0ABQ8VTB7_9AGAR|nr:hypothetical protein C8R41DRAFT_90407 [Lentinula lateritia]